MNYRFFLGLVLTVFLITPAWAFYTHDDGNKHQEARGLLYAGVGLVDSDIAADLTARLILDADVSGLHFEYHQVAQQIFVSQHQQQFRTDRLNMSYSSDTFHLKLGRQAVNLATTFFFTPNDVFAPFLAQTFNRDYKQGVDALYSEFFIGDLSQLSLILVNNTFEDVPSSKVLRYESAFKNISWMVFVGEINNPSSQNHRIVGGSIQTDIFDSIGIRSEMNIRKKSGTQITEWVLGLEYHWENDVSLNVEWFEHSIAAATANLPYNGKQYAATGLSYQITPLLLGTFNLIRNMDDQSQLSTAYLNYSLSNESILNFSILYPSGATLSEFNQYTKAVGLEYHVYF